MTVILAYVDLFILGKITVGKVPGELSGYPYRCTSLLKPNIRHNFIAICKVFIKEDGVMLCSDVLRRIQYTIQ